MNKWYIIWCRNVTQVLNNYGKNQININIELDKKKKLIFSLRKAGKTLLYIPGVIGNLSTEV